MKPAVLHAVSVITRSLWVRFHMSLILLAVFLGWEDSRDRLPALRDHKSIRLEMIEDREALLLELCGC